MRASRSLRSQAFTAAILTGLLFVLTGAAPSGDDRLPDRVVTNPPVLSDHGIVELRTYSGEPLRVELVAYTGETVAQCRAVRAQSCQLDVIWLCNCLWQRCFFGSIVGID